jgi:hypothetical protein
VIVFDISSSSFTHSRAFAKLSLLLMSNTITAAAAPLRSVASCRRRPGDGPTEATALIAQRSPAAW